MNIVLFGIGGYGKTYLSLIEKYVDKKHKIVAGVDPYCCGEELSFPVFESEDAFFDSGISADLAIISTPVYCHKIQVVKCIDAGLDILCEKPVCALYEDAVFLSEYAKKKNTRLGIGFQLSFSDAILTLKNEIKNGVYGKPLSAKCYLSWQRDRDYYLRSDWKGRLKRGDDFVLDSIISNATAHYLHNIFFVLSSSPENYDFITARANDIETFDACVIKGKLKNEAGFYYSALHCGDEYIEPVFEFEFENGTVYYNQNECDMLYSVMKDGEKKEYGALQSECVTAQKIIKMLDGNVTCKVEDVLPHLKLCNEITMSNPPETFCKTRLINNVVTVDGICKKQKMWYKTMHLPTKEELIK